MKPEGPNTPAARFRLCLELFEAGVEMMRQKIRREHPELTEEERTARLTQWLHHRPGAEHGDCVGRPRALDVPRGSP